MSIGIGQTRLTPSQSQIDEGFERVKEMPVIVTADHTAGLWEPVVLADATAGPITVTLPAVARNAGVTITVVKTDASANAVTVEGDGAETINGAANHALEAQYAVGMYYGTGAEWINKEANNLL